MGLLGSGGSSYGAVPYVPHVWYRIDLTFNWAEKEVRAREREGEGCAGCACRASEGLKRSGKGREGVEPLARGRGAGVRHARRAVAAPDDDFHTQDQPPDCL
jgi:hypothetical protein